MKLSPISQQLVEQLEEFRVAACRGTPVQMNYLYALNLQAFGKIEDSDIDSYRPILQ
jgi:hypothetical protein